MEVEDRTRVANRQNNHFIEEFDIPLDVVGDAIGAQGSNIKAARNVRGVVKIISPRSRNDGKFKVIARTREAALEARDMLDFDFAEVELPTMLVGRVRGKKSVNIDAMLKGTNSRIVIHNGLCLSNEYSLIDISGPKKSLMQIQTRLDEHINQFRAKFPLRKEERAIPSNSELRKTYGNDKSDTASCSHTSTRYVLVNAPKERVVDNSETEDNAGYWRKMYEKAVKDNEELEEKMNDIEKKYRKVLMMLGSADISS